MLREDSVKQTLTSSTGGPSSLALAASLSLSKSSANPRSGDPSDASSATASATVSSSDSSIELLDLRAAESNMQHRTNASSSHSSEPASSLTSCSNTASDDSLWASSSSSSTTDAGQEAPSTSSSAWLERERRRRARASFPLGWLLFCVFLDLFGVGLVVPLLPYYAANLGADPSAYGVLVSSYGVLQLIGSPLMGNLSDAFGRKNILLLSMAGCVVSYAGTPLVGSLAMLFLLRIPVGLLKQTVSIAYAYVTDLTSAEDRAVQLALVDAMVQLGFAFGPLVGGQLSEYDMRYPAFLSAFFYLVNLIVGYLTLPDIPVRGTVQTNRRAGKPTESTSASGTNAPRPSGAFRSVLNGMSEAIGDLRLAFREWRVSYWLIFHVIASLAVMVFDSNFPMWLKANFDLSPKETGWVISYTSLLSVAAQTFGLRLLSRRLSEFQVIFLSALLGSLCYAGIAFEPDILLFALILIPRTFSDRFLKTCITSQLTKASNQGSTGALLGLASSMDSVGRIFAPSLGGVLLAATGGWGTGFASASLYLVLLLLTQSSLFHEQPLPRPTSSTTISNEDIEILEEQGK
mmetsp:Transcript_17167/g.51306  ORF Transcript_17167/g.51306 Transcript_17167/m.51306 type:complete len:575 (-) Transcript_17167:73-1797(-)